MEGVCVDTRSKTWHRICIAGLKFILIFAN